MGSNIATDVLAMGTDAIPDWFYGKMVRLTTDGAAPFDPDQAIFAQMSIFPPVKAEFDFGQWRFGEAHGSAALAESALVYITGEFPAMRDLDGLSMLLGGEPVSARYVIETCADLAGDFDAHGPEVAALTLIMAWLCFTECTV